MSIAIMAKLMVAWTAVEQLSRAGLGVTNVDVRNAKPTIWLEDGSKCGLPGIREIQGGKTALVADYCGCRIKWRSN